MTAEFDTGKINAMLQDFYNATGIDMDLLKADFTPASGHRLRNNRYCSMVQSTAAGRLACRSSDTQLLELCAATGQTQTHICHAGLMDVAIPIVYDESILGYIIFGRMKPNRDFSVMENYIARLGLPVAETEDAYDQIPFFDRERIDSLSSIATLMVKYILLEKMLTPRIDGSIEMAVSYISDNLHREISVQDISRNTNLSKTALYEAFHQRFHCTVGSYINAKRVERSMELLQKTELNMEEIAQRVGFSSASYFSKIFKKQTGRPPLQYRKASRKTAE